MTNALFQLGIFSAPLEAAQKEDRSFTRTVSKCARMPMLGIGSGCANALLFQ